MKIPTKKTLKPHDIKKNQGNTSFYLAYLHIKNYPILNQKQNARNYLSDLSQMKPIKRLFIFRTDSICL